MPQLTTLTLETFDRDFPAEARLVLLSGDIGCGKLYALQQHLTRRGVKHQVVYCASQSIIDVEMSLRQSLTVLGIFKDLKVLVLDEIELCNDLVLEAFKRIVDEFQGDQVILAVHGTTDFMRLLTRFPDIERAVIMKTDSL